MGIRATKHEIADWQQRGLIAAPRRAPLPEGISEKQFQAEVIQVARRAGWMVHHHTISKRSEPGWPDLALCHPGRAKFILAELKTNDGAVSTEQQVWIQSLNQCGVDCRLWRPCQWQSICEILEGR